MLPFLTETETLWDRLARTQKPIVLYGMGLGAEKTLEALESRGLKAAEVFASDEFVRGHSFRGYRVKKLSELQSQYEDFFILVTFAFWQQELIDRVEALERRYELAMPHLPVVGRETVGLEDLQAHQGELLEAYGLLADEQSRRVFAGVLNFQLSGKIGYIRRVTTPKSEAYQLLGVTRKERYLDLGAYDGDTIRETMEAAKGPLERVVAVEPDPKNFRKLQAFAQGMEPPIQLLNVGVYHRDTQVVFANRAGRHAAVSRDGQGVLLPMRSIDSIAAGEAFTLIKMDVEGEEALALEGGREQLSRFAPKLMVSAYHRNEDLYRLPLLIHQIQPGYRIYLRQHPYLPAWDNNFYCKPG